MTRSIEAKSCLFIGGFMTLTNTLNVPTDSSTVKAVFSNLISIAAGHINVIEEQWFIQ